MRHTTKPPEEHIIIRSLSLTMPSGFEIEEHAHLWAQFIYATNGVMTVTTEDGTWVVPSRRAVWVPSMIHHSIVMTGTVTMRTLFFRPRLVKKLPVSCRVMGASSLMRELILRTIELGFLYKNNPKHMRLLDLIVDELQERRETALELQMPSDPRSHIVAQRVHDNPRSNESLHYLVKGCGASPRTIERAFQRELGMTFGQWRQQVKLLHALRLLADGSSVSNVAREVGYENTSAFIAMFKRTMGLTPHQYFMHDEAHAS
ncbi:MAG: helix-turn-helix transcriptional regulator [Planctomycetota bacterium]|nr:helix-turn-helix transcriptional regulator [Planctomycetota bacterium]